MPNPSLPRRLSVILLLAPLALLAQPAPPGPAARSRRRRHRTSLGRGGRPGRGQPAAVPGPGRDPATQALAAKYPRAHRGPRAAGEPGPGALPVRLPHQACRQRRPRETRGGIDPPPSSWATPSPISGGTPGRRASRTPARGRQGRLRQILQWNPRPTANFRDRRRHHPGRPLPAAGRRGPGGFQPRAIMLMIGTNNAGTCTSAEIAEGVGAVVLELRHDFPDAKILLLGIFPRSIRRTTSRRPCSTSTRSSRGLDGRQT